MIRAVVAYPSEPTARELVIAGDVIAHPILAAVRLLAAAPDHLGSADERVIDRSPQRAPPERRVDAEEPGREPAQVDTADDAGWVVAVRVGHSKIDVRRFGEILVAAQVSHVAQVAALARLEQRFARVAPEDLAGRLEEDPRVWNKSRHRNPRIVDAIFPAHQVGDDERPVG